MEGAKTIEIDIDTFNFVYADKKKMDAVLEKYPALKIDFLKLAKEFKGYYVFVYESTSKKSGFMSILNKIDYLDDEDCSILSEFEPLFINEEIPMFLEY
jgi:hypothetical protein